MGIHMAAVMSNVPQMGKQNDSLGLMAGLQSLISFFSFGAKKEADHNAMMFDGYHQMLDGLSLLMQGIESSLNKQIDSIMDNEQASLTDDAYYSAVELNNAMSAFIQLMVSEDQTPAKLRHQILSVRERLSILLDLERQFRPASESHSQNMVMPKSNIVDFQQDREFKVGGWTEI